MNLTMRGLVCLLCLLFGTQCCDAELIGYDPIGYDAVGSSISGSDGGFGFAGPWEPGGFNASTSQNHRIGEGGLSYLNLQTSGNHVRSTSTSSISGITRDFDSPLGEAGTTRYVSFLVRPEGNLGRGSSMDFSELSSRNLREPKSLQGNQAGAAWTILSLRTAAEQIRFRPEFLLRLMKRT